MPTESSVFLRTEATFSDFMLQLFRPTGQVSECSQPNESMQSGVTFEFLDHPALSLFEGASPKDIVDHFVFMGALGGRDGLQDLDDVQAQALSNAFRRSLRAEPKRKRISK